VTPGSLTSGGGRFGEDERAAGGDHDRVLELGDEAAVGRAQRPAVVALDRMGGAGREERLDGQHEALPQHGLVVGVLDAGDARRLVQVAADPVAVEVGDDTEAVAAGPPLDGSADVPQRSPGPGRGHGLALGQAGGVEQLSGAGRDPADRGAGARVGPVAVELGRDVHVDQVALAQRAEHRGDAVRRLVVHADAGGGGEAHRQLGRRPGPVAAQHLAPDRVEGAGGHAGRHRGQHRVPRLGHDLPDPPQGVQLVLVIDRHPADPTGGRDGPG
jgi:hypothetical protein